MEAHISIQALPLVCLLFTHNFTFWPFQFFIFNSIILLYSCYSIQVNWWFIHF